MITQVNELKLQVPMFEEYAQGQDEIRGGFDAWVNSDNVIKTGPDEYKTQDSQYAIKFTLAELKKYYEKEFGTGNSNMHADKEFFIKDKTGRGYSNTIGYEDVAAIDETDYDGLTSAEWAEEAEVGDDFESSTIRMTRIK